MIIKVLLLHTATECFMIDSSKKKMLLYIKVQKKEKSKNERTSKKMILIHEKFDIVMQII